MPDAPPSVAAPAPRAQLIHIDVDRRLGHEWDEGDGKPLPDEGNYDSAPKLFFGWSVATIVGGGVCLGLCFVLLAPRLALVHPALPNLLWLAWGVALGVSSLWW